TVNSIATSQVIFAILFIGLLAIVMRAMWSLYKQFKEESKEREKKVEELYEEYKAEAKEREKKLLEHLEKSNESQERTSQTLVRIQESLVSLESRVDEGLSDVWKKIDQIDDK